MNLEKEYPPEKIAKLVNLTYTEHAKKRAQQRGININLAKLATLYATSFFKQGLIFHVVKNSDLPDNFSEKLKNELKNIVIIVASDGPYIVTCYKDKNAMHNIKKKTKRLAKCWLAA